MERDACAPFLYQIHVYGPWLLATLVSPRRYLPSRWSCLHSGFAADHLHCRQSNPRETIRVQSRTGLIILSIAGHYPETCCFGRVNAFDGTCPHPPREQNNVCFDVPFILWLIFSLTRRPDPGTTGFAGFLRSPLQPSAFLLRRHLRSRCLV